MIKRFNNFVKEIVENIGESVGGDTDLFPKSPLKQTINRSIPTMDFLRVGKHILTKKIDGFIDSVQNESIYITDRMTGKTKKYTLKEVLKELTQKKDDKPDDSFVKGFEGTPAWATKQKIYESFDDEYYPERERELDPDEVEVAEEQDLKYSDDEEIERGTDDEEIERGTDDEEDDDEENPDTKSMLRGLNSNKIRFGTEDNPEGLPNKGNKRDMPNESWVNYWKSFNQKQVKLVTEDLDETEEEDEVKIVRGTEDNPFPERKKLK